MNYLQSILLSLLILMGVCVSASANLEVWFASSASKIMRNANPIDGADKWELSAARNEVEACQIVLLCHKPVQDVKVTVSELRHSRGQETLKPTVNSVAYIPSVDKKTAYPDPLPPYKPFSLKPDEAQPVWISIRIPQNAVPGIYNGKVEVVAGSITRKLPFSVKVWDFALPQTPSCVTAFGLSAAYIAPQHGLDVNSAKFKRIFAKYYEMLLDHKISPYHLPVDLNSNEAAKYLNDPRMTSYMIPYLEKDEDLKRLVKRLIDGGWYKKGYFYPVDEPNTPEGYKSFDKVVDRLRSIEPNYHIVLPFFCNPDFDYKLRAYDMMLGKVNIWCPESCLWDDVNVWNPQKGPDKTLGPLMEARRKAGDSVWWYVCCGPGSPYCNFFLDMDAMQHRMLFWQQKMKGVQGLLYWETAYWNASHGCPDPWETMTTLTHVNPTLMGDGSLLYPGKKVGIDGPVSAQRLEVIRDGIEDFEYLTLAEERLGKGATHEYIAKLVRSLTDYERDPKKLECVRKELGEKLEKATIKARKKL